MPKRGLLVYIEPIQRAYTRERGLQSGGQATTNIHDFKKMQVAWIVVQKPWSSYAIPYNVDFYFHCHFGTFYAVRGLTLAYAANIFFLAF